MFRAQQNPFDEAVVKATDENLTSENWEFIFNVVDKVASEESGAKDAVAAMIRRLAHRNANVQLYTLELANALSQNCGVKMHKELASRSFTEALLRLAGDRNTHQQVKTKILERMAEWTEMFSKDPDLGIMDQAYMRLKTQNPNLHPPSKPQKTQITDADRKREEDELQMALKLSIQDSKPTGQASSSRPSQSSPAAGSSSQAPAQSQPVPSGTTAATVSRVRALYDFQPSEPGELQFRKGDIIAVLESVYKDWWKGSLRGQTGIFPLNYVEKLQDPTREELEREAAMEAEVFGEIKNVEKLLALLSTSSEKGGGDVRENEEITTLYHSTLAIRPKLIELIGKYSQKKDDFTQLNEKFIKARRDYESLLEASMSHPPQPSYGRFGYNAPPPGPPQGQSPGPGYGGGGYQPQGAPPDNRFYSPPPTDPPYQQQNSSAPFYFVPPGQQQPSNAPTQRQSPKPGSADPYSRIGGGAIGGGRPQSMAFPPGPASGLAPPSGPSGRPQSMVFPPGAGSGPAPQGPSHPQELATGSFDSPIDNRQSFLPGQPPSVPPPQQQQPQQQSYEPYSQQPPTTQSPFQAQHPPPPQHQHQHQQQQQQGHPPQRTGSYDSPTSVYSQGPGGEPYADIALRQRMQQNQQQQQQQPPPPQQQQQQQQPSHAPPGIPSVPSVPPPNLPDSPAPVGAGAGYPALGAGAAGAGAGAGQQGYQAGAGYQAYRPPGGAPRGVGVGAGGGDDADSFYR